MINVQTTIDAIKERRRQFREWYFGPYHDWLLEKQDASKLFSKHMPGMLADAEELADIEFPPKEWLDPQPIVVEAK